MRVQVEALKERVSAHEREAHEIGDRLTRERQDATAATAELNEARGKVEKLSDRVMELERALVAQTTEAEVLGRRVQELETRMVDQAKMLSDRELEISRLNETVPPRTRPRSICAPSLPTPPTAAAPRPRASPRKRR